MKKSLLVLASFLLFSVFFFMAGGEKTNKLDIRFKGESFFEGLKIVQKKNGIQNWILTAKRADISKEGDKAALVGVEVDVKNRGVMIYAEKGTYDLNTKKMFVEGAITAKSKDYSITTGQLEIDSTAGLLTTGSDIHIEGRKFSLQGKGMEIINGGEKVRILSDVKAIFNN
jgi:LPS export ABC transporter protein LptC